MGGPHEVGQRSGVVTNGTTQPTKAVLRSHVARATTSAPTSVDTAATANIPGIVSAPATWPPRTDPRITPIANAVPENRPWAVACTDGGTALETYVTVPT